MTAGTRIVFERTRVRRRTTDAGIGVVIGAITFAIATSAPVVAIAAVLAAPIVALGWLRAGRRVALDAAGITIRTRFGGSRRIAWADYAAADPAARRRMLPPARWSADEMVMPAELADADPVGTLDPPTHTRRAGVQLASFYFAHPSGRWYFRLFESLMHLRAADPAGDWDRQLDIALRARAAYDIPVIPPAWIRR